MFIPGNNLYKAEWLDLVFDDRNKNYGAYELRSHYAQTMLRAMAVTVTSVVAAAFTVAIITKKPQTSISPPDKVTLVDLTKVMQPPPETKPLKPSAPPPVTPPNIRTAVIPTRITSEPTAAEPLTIKELETSAISNETHEGTAPGINSPATSTANGSGSGAEAGTDDDKAIHTYADVSPEPNGGMAGWSKFLQSHIKYPDTEAQGRVILSFVVERDGSLTDIKVVKSVDSQLDAEALRVLKIAPKWKPGMQSGKPVRVQYTIPINFQQNN